MYNKFKSLVYVFLLTGLLLVAGAVVVADASPKLENPILTTSDPFTVVFQNRCETPGDCTSAATSNPANDKQPAIIHSEPTTITIILDATPADGTPFKYYGTMPDFTLWDIGDSQYDRKTFSVEPAVPYSFSQYPAEGWKNLSSVVCTYSFINTTISPIFEQGNIVGLIITPDAADSVTCTMFNEKNLEDIFYWPMLYG